MKSFGLVALFLVATNTSFADIYKCKDANGRSVYQQEPCADSNQGKGEIIYESEKPSTRRSITPPTTYQPKPLSPEEAKARKEKIESQFSAWDGSHINLERYIEQAMKDPDSYDHVKTVYWDRGDHLIVQTTFRGKNSFGATVINSIKAKIALDGDIIAILDD